MESNLDRLADEIYERFENRLRDRDKRNRSDSGTGDVRIGAILRRYRGDRSIRSLDEESGLHYSFIGRIERGERGMSLESFAALADVLGADYALDTIRMVNVVNNPDRYNKQPRSTEPAGQPEVQAQPRPASGDEAGDVSHRDVGEVPTFGERLAASVENYVRSGSPVFVPDGQF